MSGFCLWGCLLPAVAAGAEPPARAARALLRGHGPVPSFDFHGWESIAQTSYLRLLSAILGKAFLWRKGAGILCPARCFTLTLKALRIKCIVLLLKDLNVFFPVYTVCFYPRYLFVFKCLLVSWNTKIKIP